MIQAGGDFYIVYGLPIWFDGHFVESTGRTVDLAIGRDGRTANVVNLSTRETYRDDQAVHARAVQEAQTEYQAALVEYAAGVRAHNDAVVRARDAKAAHDRERAKLAGELDAQIAKVIPALVERNTP